MGTDVLAKSYPQCDKRTTSDKSTFNLSPEASVLLQQRGSVRQRKFCAFYLYSVRER